MAQAGANGGGVKLFFFSFLGLDILVWNLKYIPFFLLSLLSKNTLPRLDKRGMIDGVQVIVIPHQFPNPRSNLRK